MPEEKLAQESQAATVAVSFESYRINRPSDAPPGARSMRGLWGGEAKFQRYCEAYNRLVDALTDCVAHGDISHEAAKKRLEKCREF